MQQEDHVEPGPSLQIGQRKDYGHPSSFQESTNDVGIRVHNSSPNMSFYIFYSTI